MNIQELATLAELDLPVAVLVFNNAQLGLVRQQQELFYGRRYKAAHFTSVPDFAALARAFGIRGLRLDPDRDPLAELSAALAAPGPCVIDIPIHEQANVYPMVPPGAPNRHMIAEPNRLRPCLNPSRFPNSPTMPAWIHVIQSLTSPREHPLFPPPPSVAMLPEVFVIY